MEYISVEKLKKEILKSPVWTGLGIISRIDVMSSIDLVFCEDCRDCVEKGTGTDCPSGYGYLYCTRKKTVVNEDDYCSWGVRR